MFYIVTVFLLIKSQYPPVGLQSANETIVLFYVAAQYLTVKPFYGVFVFMGQSTLKLSGQPGPQYHKQSNFFPLCFTTY